ncbi:MAG TPA: DUF2892 domain-containing protein [Ignavibacteriaceae bacterium]|nr:DUF2892 domain-containing protein [Ignavibacteriaceae bacterium]
MKKNVGKIDRLLRGTAALVIIILFLTKVIEGQGALFLGIIAIVLLFTSLTSFCPCYIRLNVNTSGSKNKPEIQ